MKNYRDLFGIVANAVLVLALLFAIMIGLNKIGVYELPNFVERIIGTSEVVDSGQDVGDTNVYSTVNYKVSDSASEEISLNSNNIKNLVMNITPAENYRQSIYVVNYSDDAEKNEKMSIVCKGGYYDIIVMDSDGHLIKNVSESDTKTSVTVLSTDGVLENFEVDKGSFSVWEEVGIILNSNNFISSDYELAETDFMVQYGDFGAEAIFEFVTDFQNYSQREIYTLSLDYGIVISAECYEEDVLVYSMKTSSLEFLNS